MLRALKFVDGLQTGIIDKIPDEDVRGRLGLPPIPDTAVWIRPPKAVSRAMI